VYLTCKENRLNILTTINEVTFALLFGCTSILPDAFTVLSNSLSCKALISIFMEETVLRNLNLRGILLVELSVFKDLPSPVQELKKPTVNTNSI
jgi:hypothetical protein